MNKDQIIVTKNSEEKEFYSEDKLRYSLRSCGATSNQVDVIINQVNHQIYNGISTNEIYKKAFSILKKFDRAFASRYSLKRALFELGPTGYPFERLIGALLKEKGYDTKVGVILQGHCVTHEIDVLAEKDGSVYAIECKFHSDSKATSNVKVPLYINSRFLDVQKFWNASPKNDTNLKQGWLVTNTRFTKDAIDYGKCIGLTLLSWDYPKGNGMKINIDSYGLYPVTALTTLTKKEKQQLIATDFILIKELYSNLGILQKMHISTNRIQQTKNEIDKLLHYDNFTNETR
ncbi:restriction endonuclease [Pareuzebyella sediminis]|uniref:restriction endonuclease n=1 Tax=Pareuzebyella sediminis TaxID=2607998 RepID=UPI0011EDEC71|nr:restriction endonuclease [Pareuzebyella sediminis]